MIKATFSERFKAIATKLEDKPFIISLHSNKTYTYNDFYKLVLKCNFFFKENSLKAGDTVVINLKNSIEMSVIFFSISCSGLKVVPCRHESPEKEILRICNLVKPKLLITDGDSDIKIKKINSKNININESFNWLKQKEYDLSEKGSELLITTSGTTGEPKILVIDILKLLDSAKNFSDLYISMNSKSIFWNFLSMSYLGGLYNLLLIPFQVGGAILISNDFNNMIAFNFWKIVKKYKVNVLWLVPSIVRVLIRLAERNSKKHNKSFANKISLALLGTAPIDASEKNQFYNTFNIKLYENYGLSETTFISYEPESSKKYEQDCVGNIIKNIEIKINNKTEEIEVKTPYLFEGYLDSYGKLVKKNSKKSFFPTGDLGKIENNKLFLKGRSKDIIKKGGVLIYLKEIENLLYKIKEINEVAAVGIKDDFYGENFIVFYTSDHKDKVERKIENYLSENLPKIRMPFNWFCIPEMPKTSNGKIIKAALDKISSSFVKEEIAIFNKPLAFSSISSKLLPAISIDINQVVYNMKRAGKKITTLSLGEAFFKIPQYEFNNLDFQKGYHYSDTSGIPELRKKIADYYQYKYEAPVFPSEIVISAGSKVLIFMVMKAILNQGDQVVVHEPAWLSYDEHAKMCNAKIKFIPYKEKIENFKKYINRKTKLFILNNPNNPRGRVYSEDEIRKIYKLCRENSVYFMVDEAYSDFMIKGFPSLAKVAPSKDGVIIVNSLSKNLGVSGWRIGYIICNKFLREQIIKFNQHLITCAPTILCMYIEKYFDLIIPTAEKEINKLIKKRLKIEEYMNKEGLNFLSGSATFYYFISIDNFIGSDKEFSNMLLTNYNISVVPGSAYGKSTSRFIRVSIGTEQTSKIIKALQCIKSLIHTKNIDKKKLLKDLRQWQYQ